MKQSFLKSNSFNARKCSVSIHFQAGPFEMPLALVLAKPTQRVHSTRCDKTWQNVLQRISPPWHVVCSSYSRQNKSENWKLYSFTSTAETAAVSTGWSKALGDLQWHRLKKQREREMQFSDSWMGKAFKYIEILILNFVIFCSIGFRALVGRLASWSAIPLWESRSSCSVKVPVTNSCVGGALICPTSF